MKRYLLTIVFIFIGGDFIAPAVAAPPENIYEVFYDIHLQPKEGVAQVVIRIGEGAEYLHELRFKLKSNKRYAGFKGNGEIQESEQGVRWLPPPEGGQLSYTVHIDHARSDDKYDAYMTEHWALVRGDDLVPPARVFTETGSRAQAQLHIHLPEKWKAVVPYAKAKSGGYTVDHPQRRFDRPVGWMLFGKIGVVRETISNVKVIIASPTGQHVRRQDMLAMLRWNLPSLAKLLPVLPKRLLVVSAADPMWHGGLSGPYSLYLHADRPLISADGTSPLLHELMHVVMRARAGKDGDWIVEGLAELYSIELLLRSGTISQRRYEKILAHYQSRGATVKSLAGKISDGADTARAVSALYALNTLIRQQTQGKRQLDDVLRAMVATPATWTVAQFRAMVIQVCGVDPDKMFASLGIIAKS